MRRSSVQSRAAPRFIWQGALIILPALLLAGMGLFALRQDRMLARMEAEERAKRWLGDLTTIGLPQVLGNRLTEMAKLHPDDAGWRFPKHPRDDALMRVRSSQSGVTGELIAVACLLDNEGGLLYPPEPAGVPLSQPLILDALTLAQQDAWFACEEMWINATPEWDLLQAFVTSGAPERLAVMARFWTALLAVASESNPEFPRGVAELEHLRAIPREVVSESGIPVGDLAALRLGLLGEALSKSNRAQVVQELCAQLLAEPSPVSEAIWEKLSASEPLLETWASARKLHIEAREFSRLLKERGSHPGPITLSGEECWLIEQAVVGGRWLAAMPIPALRRALEQMHGTVIAPQDFGLAVELDGRALLPRAAEQAILAQESVELTGLPLQLAVFLADAAAFDAKRAQRARWTMALIGVALAAVCGGFFAAWSAFRRQQQLSEMKTNFVSSVSHELRAPIASVQLMAEELVEGERPTDEKLAKYHRFIGQECRRLSAVIENVLDFARREQGRERFQFEPTDVRKLIRGTVELLRPYAAERNVRIAEVCHGNAHEILADGQALQRVMVNLLDNAIKHSPAGSEVVVGLEFDEPRMLMWVEDEGPGIARGEQQQIFERFYRIGPELQRQTQGVGLGLAIVKHLVEVHGGKVFVHSDIGEGSRFVVELQAEPSSIKKFQNVTSV